MASCSRTAQQKLADLEKNDAPFHDQLVEASKFLGLDISALENVDYSTPKSFHGKEEWVMRWLLKKLQGNEGTSMRLNALSWQLLHHVIRIVPIPVVARLLKERKFMTILCQTLEDAKKRPTTSLESSSVTISTESRKRKRNGNHITGLTDSSSREHVEAILATLSYLINLSKNLVKTSASSRSTVATVELMKSVLRTNTDEAAKILGSWLLLCTEYIAEDASVFLDPFIQIWECRKIGVDSTTDFSLHCIKALLSFLLRYDNEPYAAERDQTWKSRFERLLAQNVILPAQSSSGARTKLIVAHAIENVNFAPTILETCIRCVQSQGSHLDWIPELFAALKVVIGRPGDSLSVLNKMLSIAIQYHVKIDTELLQTLTIEYAFQDEDVDTWEIIAKILKLDSNLFLSSAESKSSKTSTLLQQLLSRITLAPFQKYWDTPRVKIIIEEIAVSLMKEFAKDRKLKTFVEHWYGQICKFIELPQFLDQSPDHFCIWEGDALQNTFSDVMESSLDTPRVIELIDWVESQLQLDESASVSAACVLLQAIANSLCMQAKETVDPYNSLRLSEMLLTKNVKRHLSSQKSERFSWRKWRVLTSIISKADYPAKHAIAIWSGWSKELNDGFANLGDDNLENLGSYNAIRCVFALWNAINLAWVEEKDQHFQTSIEMLAIKLLESIDKHLSHLKRRLKTKSSPIPNNNQLIDPTWTLSRSFVWYSDAYVACLMVEYPKILELVPKMKSSRQQILDRILKRASRLSLSYYSLYPQRAHNEVLNEFSGLWMAALKHEDVLQNPVIHSQLIDVMLENTTVDIKDQSRYESYNNDNSSTCNIFVAESLSIIPTQLFTRHQRELVMKSWAPKMPRNFDPSISVPQAVSLEYLDPVIWSLKCKMMNLHTSYEGLRFEDLRNVAKGFSTSGNLRTIRISTLIPIFGEMTRLTLSHMLSSVDSKTSLQYLQEIATFFKQWSEQAKEILSHPYSGGPPTFTHMEVILIDMVLQAFTGKAILQQLDIISYELLEEVKTLFRDIVILDLRVVFDSVRKDAISRTDQKVNPGCLINTPILSEDKKVFFSCALNALDNLEVSENDLKPCLGELLSCLTLFHEKNPNSYMDEDDAWRMTAFIFARAPVASELLDFPESVNTLATRIATKQIAEARALRKDSSRRVQIARDLAQSLEENMENMNENQRLGKLMSLNYTIGVCEDSKSNNLGHSFTGLPAIYSQLTEIMQNSKSGNELCLASEILVNVLHAKEKHIILQHNIDSILGSITTICSSNGPSINPKHAGKIFSHLCDLLQAVLSDRDHRRKIRGHFHVLLQPMQALLRCLFTPRTTKTSSRSSRLTSPPPWLPTFSSQVSALYPLTKHAEQFTRLVTLICDPPSSIVSENKRSDAADLNSARKRAKRDAGEHMIYLLSYYLKLQSEMKMSRELKEVLRPALWSILDITDVEARGRIVGEMGDGDRVGWNELWRDWNEYGKYKGN